MAQPTTQLNATEQDTLVKQIGLALLRAAPRDWRRVTAHYRAVGRYHELTGEVLNEDGSVGEWMATHDIATLFGRLRAGMYREGRGTWFNARYQLDHPSSYNLEYDREEPRWDLQPPPQAYADELRMFPRSEENVPEWLMRRMSGLGPEQPGPRFRIARIFDGQGPDGRPVLNRPELDADELDRLYEYLSTAPVVLSERGLDLDRLASPPTAKVPVAFHTDGTWIWPAAVNYYLQEYGIAPEAELVAHVQQAGFRVPEVPEQALQAAGAHLTRGNQPPPPPPRPVVPEVPEQQPVAEPATTFTPAPVLDDGPPTMIQPPVQAEAESPVLDTLRGRLKELGVPESAYRIGEPARHGWSMEQVDSGWRVGWYDDELTNPAVFGDAEDAAAFMLGKLLLAPREQQAVAPGLSPAPPIQPDDTAPVNGGPSADRARESRGFRGAPGGFVPVEEGTSGAEESFREPHPGSREGRGEEPDEAEGREAALRPDADSRGPEGRRETSAFQSEAPEARGSETRPAFQPDGGERHAFEPEAAEPSGRRSLPPEGGEASGRRALQSEGSERRAFEPEAGETSGRRALQSEGSERRAFEPEAGETSGRRALQSEGSEPSGRRALQPEGSERRAFEPEGGETSGRRALQPEGSEPSGRRALQPEGSERRAFEPEAGETSGRRALQPEGSERRAFEPEASEAPGRRALQPEGGERRPFEPEAPEASGRRAFQPEGANQRSAFQAESVDSRSGFRPEGPEGRPGFQPEGADHRGFQQEGPDQRQTFQPEGPENRPGFQPEGGDPRGFHPDAAENRPGFQPEGGEHGGFQPPARPGFQPEGGEHGGFQPPAERPGFQSGGSEHRGFQPDAAERPGFQPDVADRPGFQPEGPDHRGFQPEGGEPGGFQPPVGRPGFQPDGGEHGGFQPDTPDRPGFQPDGPDHRGFQPEGGDPRGFHPDAAENRPVFQPESGEHGGFQAPTDRPGFQPEGGGFQAPTDRPGGPEHRGFQPDTGDRPGFRPEGGEGRPGFRPEDGRGAEPRPGRPEEPRGDLPPRPETPAARPEPARAEQRPEGQPVRSEPPSPPAGEPRLEETIIDAPPTMVAAPVPPPASRREPAPQQVAPQGAPAPQQQPAQPRRAAAAQGGSGQGQWPVQPLPGEPPLTLFRGKEMRELPAGSELDRFGNPDGNLTYAAGTPFEERSLVPEWVDRPYHVYRVQRPIEALAGVAIPWFNQPGGGAAYLLPASIEELLAEGDLIELDPGEPPID
ncbi:hypothetical protein FHX82_004555 [Amycolatopsis bartoniae]|uniref:TNT domain-containing protein n=1 Tax=Amycolatopsis bartoniae TaxID=941986 RepID=A0A8H9J0F7_9PSEU|nr:glycohydrolase toxin TNT-related protein [Amycolatopsis bartoniae]MBB2937482.1 hypothetical protein [Amycolatopsis bartoniae]GHF87086.1 hypothetical protein GCM10017566_71220 [Amycolatopsis bartoniae]